MGGFKVRGAVAGDVKRVAELEKICFSSPWSEKSFFEEITGNEVACYVVAEIGEEIIGYAGAWLICDEGHITNVAVHPDFRGRGVAMALVSTLISTLGENGASAYTLEVRASNEGAISLYWQLNFIECGVRKGYYDDNGEDAVIMWKIQVEDIR